MTQPVFDADGMTPWNGRETVLTTRKKGSPPSDWDGGKVIMESIDGRRYPYTPDASYSADGLADGRWFGYQGDYRIVAYRSVDANQVDLTARERIATAIVNQIRQDHGFMPCRLNEVEDADLYLRQADAVLASFPK